jgi:hypothetical protein
MAVISLDTPEGIRHHRAWAFQHLHEHIGAADQRTGDTLRSVQRASGGQNIIQHRRVEAKGA